MSDNLKDELRSVGEAKIAGDRITGLACTWKPYHLVDDIWEQVLPSAFTPDSMRNTYACLDHDKRMYLADVPTGTLELKVGEEGLEFGFDVDQDDDDSRRAFSKVRKGFAKQSSWRFNGAVDSWRREGGKRIRTIHSVQNVVDVCPVYSGANKNTKAGIRNANDFADALRSWETFSRLEYAEQIKNEKNI